MSKSIDNIELDLRIKIAQIKMETRKIESQIKEIKKAIRFFIFKASSLLVISGITIYFLIK